MFREADKMEVIDETGEMTDAEREKALAVGAKWKEKALPILMQLANDPDVGATAIAITAVVNGASVMVIAGPPLGMIDLYGALQDTRDAIMQQLIAETTGEKNPGHIGTLPEPEWHKAQRKAEQEARDAERKTKAERARAELAAEIAAMAAKADPSGQGAC